METKTLVLYYDNGNKPIFRKCFNDSGIESRYWLKNDSVFLIDMYFKRFRCIRTILKDLIYYFPEGTDGLIILFDTNLSEPYLDTIRKRNPRAKIVIWFWNEIYNEKMLNHLKKFDIWSYSPRDCEKYGLIYNPQFFFDSVLDRYRSFRNQEKMQGKQGFIFLGREKGRFDTIQSIADEIKKCGWGCETDYLSTSIYDRPLKMGIKYSPGFQYEVCVEKVLEFQGILDAAYKQNSGLSLRVMESIFFHKKLITTNPLVSVYDFFDENNIYVWGWSKISLEEFLSRPYRPVPDDICKTYLISSWLSRFKAYYGME